MLRNFCNDLHGREKVRPGGGGYMPWPYECNRLILWPVTSIAIFSILGAFALGQGKAPGAVPFLSIIALSMVCDVTRKREKPLSGTTCSGSRPTTLAGFSSASRN